MCQPRRHDVPMNRIAHMLNGITRPEPKEEIMPTTTKPAPKPKATAPAPDDTTKAVVETTPETAAPIVAPALRGELREIPKRPRPVHRSTQTFTMVETDDVVTLDIIVTHAGGGMDADSPFPTKWEELPESGQAGWENYGIDEWEFHFRLIPF
jgi:hypothetical protein